MSIYYNLTIINFQQNCSKIIQKTEYISECFYDLYQCCRDAVKQKIQHFNKCENETEYMCSYTVKEVEPANLSVMILYGMAGAVIVWFLFSVCKVCFHKKCQKQQEFGFDDLEDDGTQLLE